MYDHMLNQTVKIAGTSDTDDYGEAVYDAEVEVSARVELVNKSKPTAGGEIIPIAASIWVPVDTTVEAGAKVTHDGQAYKVISKVSIPDGTGTVRLVALECTEWQ